nr:hypothetical protein [uncultured Bacteroides sp.]
MQRAITFTCHRVCPATTKQTFLYQSATMISQSQPYVTQCIQRGLPGSQSLQFEVHETFQFRISSCTSGTEIPVFIQSDRLPIYKHQYSLRLRPAQA